MVRRWCVAGLKTLSRAQPSPPRYAFGVPLEVPYTNRTAVRWRPYRPARQLGAAEGCPTRSYWWLVLAAGLGAAAAYYNGKKKKGGRRRA